MNVGHIPDTSRVEEVRDDCSSGTLRLFNGQNLGILNKQTNLSERPVQRKGHTPDITTVEILIAISV